MIPYNAVPPQPSLMTPFDELEPTNSFASLTAMSVYLIAGKGDVRYRGDFRIEAVDKFLEFFAEVGCVLGYTV